MSMIIQQGIYRDTSGARVDVIGVSIHSETGESLVVYRPIDETRQLTVMPIETFAEVVGVDSEGKSIARFVIIQSNADGPRG